MPSLPDIVAEEPTLRLPANGTTVAAEALRESLTQAAVAGNGFRIDASEVESVGQAVLQLLIAARRDADVAGTPFEIVAPSMPFLERINACGLAAAMALPEEEMHS